MECEVIRVLLKTKSSVFFENLRTPSLSWLLATALVLCLLSCSDPPPPTRKALGALPSSTDSVANNIPASVEKTDTTNDLVIYLDVSSSMKGYIRTDGQSVFSRTLRTLREFATTLDPPVNVQLRTVDSSLGSAKPNTAIADASTDPKFYSGNETNLAGAIEAFSLNGQATAQTNPRNEQPQNQPAQNSENPNPQTATTPRFHILVTDGVQYSRTHKADTPCASGSDAYCVRLKILELMNKGWAGAIIGLRSQFCCSFFSEISQRSIAYDTGKREPKDYRPFYLYIFSPDHDALDKLVARFKESLRASFDKRDLMLRELALTPKYATGEIAFNDADFQTNDRKRLTCKRVDDKLPLYLSLRLRKEAKSVRVPFQLAVNIPWTQHAIDCGNPKELSSLLKWELQSVYPTQEMDSHHYPQVSIDFSKVEADDNGSIIFQAEATWPRAAGKSAWRAYRLIGHLNQESNIPAWVREWSIDMDTKSEAGNRTLNLTTALLGVWRNPILKEQVVADLYLRVGPQ